MLCAPLYFILDIFLNFNSVNIHPLYIKLLPYIVRINRRLPKNSAAKLKDYINILYQYMKENTDLYLHQIFYTKI